MRRRYKEMVGILSGKQCVRGEDQVLWRTKDVARKLLCGQSWGGEVWGSFEGQVGPLWDGGPLECARQRPWLRVWSGGGIGCYLNLENIMQEKEMGRIKVQLWCSMHVYFLSRISPAPEDRIWPTTTLIVWFRKLSNKLTKLNGNFHLQRICRIELKRHILRNFFWHL